MTPRHPPLPPGLLAAAGTDLPGLLDPAQGGLDAPIRAEIFGSLRFQQHGRSLAATHTARVRRRGASAFTPRLNENIEVLQRARHVITRLERSGQQVSPAGAWLLDNDHLVAAQIKEIHDALPRRFFRDLPVLVDAHLAGLPRIYGVAWAFVAHTDSAFDEALLLDFLDAYQDERELTLGELWALPTTLRVVLMENLRRLAEGVAAAKGARELANHWCDQPRSAGETDLGRLVEAMAARGVGNDFALQVQQRLQASPSTRAALPEAERVALQQELARAWPDAADAQARQQAREAADNLSVGNVITSLRRLGDADWRSLIGRSSRLVRVMQGSAVFRAEREDTQDDNLHRIERLARRSGLNEPEVGRRLLALVDGVAARGEGPDPAALAPGHWLHGAGRPALQRAVGLGGGSIAWTTARHLLRPAYMASVVLGSIALAAWFVEGWIDPASGPLWWWLLAALALWPASEAVLALLHRLVSESLPPWRLPRLALADGIPHGHRVLVVVPAMLTSSAGIQALAANLARHHLANPERFAQFALLSDFGDAATPQTPADATLLAEAVAAIDALEARHGRPGEPRRFLLLHRERRWSDSEQAFIGWERKRGKLEQLLALLAAPPEPQASAFVDLGPRSQPSPGTPHVLTLDSDTVLPPGALRALVGVAAHPLNQPRLDPAGRRVAAGHGILQPRISGPLPAPDEVTPFHWLFAGQGGIDPYSAASSELYQDLFDEATFSGKGLLNVQAVHAVLGGRLPDEQVLSHDLLEGGVARCGGVSDIALIEASPMHPDLAAARIHRWTRGDWQLWPLLWHARRHGLNALGCWKALDNIRRSLVAPFSVLLLLIALFTPHLSPAAVLALLALAFGGGPLLGAVAALAPGRDDLAPVRFYRSALAEVGRALGGMAWNLVMLLRQAGLLLDAIAKATWRSAVSRRHLLQWTTAAAAEASVRHGLPALVRRHAAVSLVAAALLLVPLLLGWPVAPLAWLVLGAWVATPWWTALASRAWGHASLAPLPAPDRAYLLGVARDTWQLFERHVGPDSHHLPPDNVQTLPDTMVAQRTSPTNIGLYLLSLACARAFGWIDTAALLARAEATLATLDRLEHHRGHLLNWYDTQTLAPLPPAYVSTVDSGNLCGHLLALAVACDELRAGLPTDPQQADHAARLQALAGRCRARAEASEFGFLYDRRRRLLHLGLRVAESALDAGYYDLLASEARLASLWAIAKGDLPSAHWAALGRPFFGEGRQAGLRSWSGSMFEYLMPSLVLEEPAGSVLDSAARAAIHLQQAYGEATGLPWGISESAYAASDHSLAYQYAPQGVPRLALRRTPPDERVIAPYATLLAVMFSPAAAVANLRRLEALGARGDMGFIEALDYTADRQSAGSPHTPVCTFMAHHQGMAIVALANLLLGGAPRRWGMGDPRLAAVAPLLQERVPRELPPLPVAATDLPQDRRRQAPLHGGWLRSQAALGGEPIAVERRAGAPAPVREVVPGQSALQPTMLMSNGRYSVALRANGAGWSRWAVGSAVVDLSRWRDDALRDEHGSFLYLRRSAALPGAAPPPVVSLTQHPAPDPAAHYQASLHRDRICHDARWTDLRSRITTWVSPEDDIELRQVELWSDADHTLRLDLLSMFEVAMSEARADETHPAFANLFVEADWDAADHALYLVRKPRRAGEPTLHVVHFIAHADAPLGPVRAQTDRGRWLGRHRSSAHPLADGGPVDAPGGARTTGLDPVAALTVAIQLAPHSSQRLTLATAAASSRLALETLVDRYRQVMTIERASLMSATFAGIRQRDLQLPADDRAAIQTLSSLLLQVHARPMPAPASAGGTPCDRRSLWRFGISGDRPIVLASITTVHGMRLVHALVQALRQWTWAGLGCELVLVNAEVRSYLMPLQRALVALREAFDRDTAQASPGFPAGKLVLLYEDELSAIERGSLDALSRVHLHADGRPLWHHVQNLADWHDLQRDQRRELACSTLPDPVARPDAVAPDGRFDPRSGAFGFDLTPAQRPSRPWINVLANAGFGAQLSDAGSGCTWAGNSRLHQLTPWTNDPLRDAGGEHFYVQDQDSHAAWRIGAGAGAAAGLQRLTHAPGLSRWWQDHGGLQVDAVWCIDPVAAVKQVRIVFTNRGPRRLRARLLGVFEWLMGTQRSDRQTVHTRRERVSATAGDGPASVTDLLLATQCDDHAGYGGQTAFVSLHGGGTGVIDDWTCDRRELFDARGASCLPDHLAQTAGAGLDPCAAAGRRFTLAPGQACELVFLLGHAADAASACTLARAALAVAPAAREAAVAAHWQGLLGAVQVATPDPLFDALVNHWLPYQVVACRLWGRAGFYQAGGAYGFRDQLQDAMALAGSAPALLRAQVLLAGARQFPEGDVQHWWHAPSGAGVRTRFSDDLLWLPHATAHYLRLTGDNAVLGESLHFLDAPALPDGAEDAYTTPGIHPEAASLYEHCARSIDHSLRVGAHGLPLIGGGDWNDGMNEVGPAGRGESVWLGWFLCRVVAEFAPIARARHDGERADRWDAAARGWRAALHGAAWDGAWFVRAFFDDGSPLGSASNTECRIDLIAQAWSVLSGVGDPAMQHRAMASATRLLVDDAHGLIRLLDPPLAHATPSAGYIQAYPGGVRENGGQYNHAGVWFLMAQAALGDADGAWLSFTRLSPAHRSADPLQREAYGIEPYVMAADVYTQPPYTGRGGWSWYTGAAGWLHRAAIESICGLQLEADRLRLRPQLPSHWPAVELNLTLGGTVHTWCICRADATAEIEAARLRGARRVEAGVWADRGSLEAGSVHLLLIAESLAPTPASPPPHPAAAVDPAPPVHQRRPALGEAA